MNKGNLREQQAKDNTLTMALFILIAGVCRFIHCGKRLSASTAAATVAGLVNGAGLVMSLLLGIGIFFLLITSLAQLIFKPFVGWWTRGRGGGFGGGSGRWL